MHDIEEAPLQLTVPNDASNLRLVRLVVASAAADVEFSYDTVEDLRIVADELITLVMTIATPHTPVKIAIFPGPENFVFRGSARLASADQLRSNDPSGNRSPVVELDVLAAQIVASLVDYYGIETNDQQIDVEFSVRCPIGPTDG